MVPVAKKRRGDHNPVPVKADAFYPQLPHAPPCSGSAKKMAQCCYKATPFTFKKLTIAVRFSR
jgi:hypothetical protein